MDEKLEFVAKETEKLNVLIKDALDKHHQRQEWLNNDSDMDSDTPAIPTSVRDFTSNYMTGLSNILERL